MPGNSEENIIIKTQPVTEENKLCNTTIRIKLNQI